MTKSMFSIESGDLKFTFLNSGDIYKIENKKTLINHWLSNPIDGSLNNLFLRVHTKSGIEVYPLLGVKSGSRVSHGGKRVVWKGKAGQIDYQVTFTLSNQKIWFWTVTAEGNGQEIDIIYGQDLGLADEAAVRTNEAYMSQYIDHTTYNDYQYGFVVCSRQNQPQDGAFPYLQQGSLTKASGFSTDGFQFFGLSYKETNKPEVLLKDQLANEIYQYEFAYTALQSERVHLSGKTEFVFYGLFNENHKDPVSSLEFKEELMQAWEQVQTEKSGSLETEKPVVLSPAFGEPLTTIAMAKEEIEDLFPHRHQEEWDGDTLLSFFTDTHEHVVLKEKEMLTERAHGHIIISGNPVNNIENVLTSTSYIYGIFNSQLTVGNTSFNKMLTNARNHLNVMKTSGQRIYVEIDDTLQLLAMPSLYEMGFNFARWYYKTEDDLFIITVYTMVETPELQLQFQAVSGKSYRVLVTNQVSMNNNEYAAPFHLERNENMISFFADEKSDSAKIFPKLSYRLQVQGSDFSLTDERIFGEYIEPFSASLAVLDITPASEWSIGVQGLLYGEEMPFSGGSADAEIGRYRQFYETVMNGFKLSRNGASSEELEKMNALAWWYTHNMLIHYSVPHGLEQYGGAAWGTRDVCQGPSEYFIATQQFEAVRKILITVYSHQYEDDGNWPQWFMFDRYHKIQQEESHGDIIVWPLKALTEYLSSSHDFSILNAEVPYTRRGSLDFTDEKETILDHVRKQIAYIKNNFLHDTHLSSYGDGDWDDTLQPANGQLKIYMASSWTVALTYQTLNQFSKLMETFNEKEAADLAELASKIKSDFNRYILSSEVIPGFVYMEDPGKIEFMVHPTDTKTGIQYRLLPMTRSMIADLLTPEQADTHYQVIKERLYHPDGVRLMDRPANYTGGVSTHFKRAEQAANFGREIGLQYVHAHIRFVEAMAKLGKAEEVWKGLQTINPIRIQDAVPNAERRQSNAYFSSSDGKFKTRYEASERFDELRDGSVPVKGGWRIYSSGPGIYMNQLISNCLGIRLDGNDLILDPVLPAELDGLEFTFRIKGIPVKFIYKIEGNQDRFVLINGNKVDIETLENQYRRGGLRINQSELEKKLSNRAENTIEILM
ncbi:cellobiose phosphorylase [Bacillus sp. FJAT-27225]|uniref:GH36-type glycosyl hydrolase domain-containing protein n=1 Tax=Bacillus sp. FJAT-27225 TaxID=1743144 RepID=UPI00080C34CB|nr:amylo-alpha-1,6-glucosidase [Bacillus sp. FJAT-27225]OCA86113.1 cellobiose phosphorylase [Bacillus sp. FJAT-27225]